MRSAGLDPAVLEYVRERGRVLAVAEGVYLVG